MNTNFKTLLKQLLAGLGFSLVFGGVFVFLQALSNPSISWSMTRGFFIVIVLSASCFTLVAIPLANLFFHPSRAFTRISFGLILRGVLFLLVIGLVGAYLSGFVIRTVTPGFNLLQPRTYFATVLWVIFLGSPIFLYNVVKELWQEALKKVREKEVAQERLEKELLAAQLKNLQSQVNPHFFFNALNSIAALIAVNPRRAESMVEKLAGLFRYALDCNHTSSIRLAEELKIVEDYLAIEKVRFGDRMNYLIEAEPGVGELPVPPLLLQPLVENAVKHGVSRTEEDAGVEVRISSSGGKVTMVVENDGPAPPEQSRPSAMGIRNLQSRCQLLFGSRFQFSLSRLAGGKTRAELEIPLDSRPE